MHFPSTEDEPSPEPSSTQQENSISATTIDRTSVLTALRTVLRLLATDIVKRLHEDPQP